MATLSKTISEPITIEDAAQTGYEFTFDEYLRTPITKNRYAIEDGKVVMSPAPTTQHQLLTFELGVRLRSFVRPNKLGVVLMAPVDVIIAREPKLKTRQPDVLYLSWERTGVRGLKELIAMPVIEVAPDIVVEILSPQETQRVQARKMADYAILGVLEVWLIEPEAQTIAVWNLLEGRYAQTAMYQSGAKLHSVALPGFELDLHGLFTLEDAVDEE